MMVDNRYDGRIPEPPYECTSCAELADIKESYRNVVEGKCAGDEKHCACVPALREELERVRAKHRDVEGMAKVIYPIRYDRFPAPDGLEGVFRRDQCVKTARAVIAWLEEK